MRDPFGVHLLPSTGEWVYDTVPHRARRITEAAMTEQNRFAKASGGRADLSLALDQLQARFPLCQTVSIVCSWFASTTDVKGCAIYPSTTFIGGVSEALIDGAWQPDPWRCSSLTQASDGLIPLSQIGGSFVYGGTPSDSSIVRCIREVKARGFRAVFYPFLLLDCAGFPWRGRITYDGLDRTPAAAAAIAGFFGAAAPLDFARDNANLTVAYAGAATDWTYRRMILHYANLCVIAGGVDLFLTGSELRGLEGVRGPGWSVGGAIAENGLTTWDYPFVDAMIGLSRDVRGVFDSAGLMADRRGRHNLIAYSADWSNWMGVQHSDVAGQWPHLDSLYAADSIDLVSFDNYMPLSDWTSGDGGLDARHWVEPRATSWPPTVEAMNGLGLSGPPSLYDSTYLKANIEGGEKFAWFYANSDNAGATFDPLGSGAVVSAPLGDRVTQTRTPYRPGQELLANKMFRWWWSHPHRAVYDNGDGQGAVPRGGVSAWQPRAKSIIFGEYGFPTCDRCTNQPNVFYDPKSVESFTPFWSAWEPAEGGGQRPRRDDTLAALAHDAMIDYWTIDGNNVVDVGGLPMIDTNFMCAWNWDARPFPVFPQSTYWGDAGNWRAGSWLAGKGPDQPPLQPAAPAPERVGLVLPDLTRDGWLVLVSARFQTRSEQSASGKEMRIGRAAQPVWRIDLSFEDATNPPPGLDLVLALYARARGRAGTIFVAAPSGVLPAGCADYGLASSPVSVADDWALASTPGPQGDYGTARAGSAMLFARFADDELDVESFAQTLRRSRRVSFLGGPS